MLRSSTDASKTLFLGQGCQWVEGEPHLLADDPRLQKGPQCPAQ